MDTPNALASLSQSLALVVSTAGPSLVRVEGRRRAATGLAWSAQGHVLTAAHALETEGEESVRVGLPDGSSAAAQLVGRDAALDLALLKVDAPLQPLAHAPAPQVGHLGLALARPGRTVRATLGMVSAYGEDRKSVV